MAANNSLEIASRLMRAGKNNDARQILEGFLKENRNDMYAWWMYAETWQSIEDKKRVWGYCLRFNPGSAEAKQALITLDKPMDEKQFSEKIMRSPNNGPKNSIAFKLFSGCAGVVIILVIGWMILNFISRPDDPLLYLHAKPVEYYLYVPENYSNDRDWPLFIGVHGSGGSGLDCWNMWQSYARKEGFILLCPTIPGDSGGYYSDVGERTVWSAVENVKKNYRIQPRMFLAGFSAGAYFVQIFAYHYPDSVSGLAILSTGYSIEGVPANIPILVVIGGQDNPESIQTNKEFVSSMKQRGGDISYYVLPGVGHWPSSKTKNLTVELFGKIIGK